MTQLVQAFWQVNQKQLSRGLCHTRLQKANTSCGVAETYRWSRTKADALQDYQGMVYSSWTIFSGNMQANAFKSFLPPFLLILQYSLFPIRPGAAAPWRIYTGMDEKSKDGVREIKGYIHRKMKAGPLCFVIRGHFHQPLVSSHTAASQTLNRHNPASHSP